MRVVASNWGLGWSTAVTLGDVHTSRAPAPAYQPIRYALTTTGPSSECAYSATGCPVSRWRGWRSPPPGTGRLAHPAGPVRVPGLGVLVLNRRGARPPGSGRLRSAWPKGPRSRRTLWQGGRRLTVAVGCRRRSILPRARGDEQNDERTASSVVTVDRSLSSCPTLAPADRSRPGTQRPKGAPPWAGTGCRSPGQESTGTSADRRSGWRSPGGVKVPCDDRDAT